MRKITLYSPTVDRDGAYHDAGTELTVGAEDNHDTDLTTAQAEQLLEGSRAVTMAQAREDAGLPPVEELPDDLDSHTIPELRDIAAGEAIDLGSLTLKADIIAAIREARA